MSRLPEINYIFSQQKTVGYLACKNAAQLVIYLQRQRVNDTLVASKKDWQAQYLGQIREWTQFLTPLFDELPTTWHYISPQNRIRRYQVQP